MIIVRTRVYERKISKLLDNAEIVSAENEIASQPEKWPVVRGTGGIRKARAARGNSGKSGGVRIMYYFWSGKGRIYFLDVYAKNERENISEKDKKILRKIIGSLKGDTNA